ncbi:MAG: Telomere resolvase [Bacteriophage sp.]|nr:MAG: Telomere resolvase [Bacteriophage sp.]
MKYPTARFVFDRKHTASKTTKGTVQIEILFERKRKWISTGVRLYSDQWSEKNKVKNTVQSIDLNERLDAQIQNINEFINSLIKNKEPFNFEKLEHFLKYSQQKESFLDFIKRRVSERTDLRKGTLNTHATLINSLEEFGRIVYFSDITTANIMYYDDFLHKKYNKQTTVHGYHKRLKRYINEAIKYELLKDNPYNRLKFDRGKSEGIKYLTIDQIKQIQNLEITSESISKVRDLFVFQCFTGLSYADLSKFDFCRVIKKGSNFFIRDIRIKTEEEYFLMLLKPAMEILRKYDFKLPIISNYQYNLRLKVVQEIARIKQSLHSHMARHSFAVMALNMGVSIENLAKMMGHTDIKTTQIYAKVLNKSVQEEFEKMDSKL